MIGAGQRGARVYGQYCLTEESKIDMIGVAEPDTVLRNIFVKEHKINSNNVYVSWEDILERDKFADIAFVCTQDQMHYQVVKKAIEKGYDIVCEKPMSPKAEECVEMGELSKKFDKNLTICHVLRYSPFFTKIKEILDSGEIGEIININQIENVAYWHQSHSFVRGNWRRSEEASPMILAKSCHDLDIILYLMGKNCTRLSSFGSLKHFRKECAPENSALRCKECKIDNCPYNAYHIYLESNDWYTPVIQQVVSPTKDKQDLIKALDEGPYGRCVYHCDNDVVDHQVVNMEFEGGATASFTMCAFTLGGGRSVNIMGTRGQIIAEMEENRITVNDFLSNSSKEIILEVSIEGHSGSDTSFMKSVETSYENKGCPSVSSADKSVMSHLMALAAEESRLTKKEIDLSSYIESFK